MTADLALTVFFTLLMVWLLVVSGAASVQARRALGIMGSYGPADKVIWGLRGLAGAVVSTTVLILGQRLLFYTGGLVVPLVARTVMFTALLILVCASFTAVAYGFWRQAEEILALRHHWHYTQGLHLPADPISTESLSDGDQPNA